MIWTGTPPHGTPINRAHPWVTDSGMQGFYPLNEGAGGAAYDAFGRVNLATGNFGAANPWSTAIGSGLKLSASSENATGILPTSLQFGLPLWIACAFRVLGTPSADANYFSLLYNNAHGAPFNVIALTASPGANSFTLFWNFGGANDTTPLSGGTLTAGQDVVLFGTITPASSQILYLNGANVASASHVASNPAYTATSMVAFGAPPTNTVNPNALLYWGAWGTILPTVAQIAAMSTSPNAIWQIFQPFSPLAYGLSATTTFQPWIFGDQIQEMYG